jgi:AraC family transcriptional regulator of adaptative response/methylated-DNA-[protein]-cysteine methyltransferase
MMTIHETERDPRWRAVRTRDARADGTFVYSVKTTGVYCRPSCGSRLALPANVAFHRTNADAERAGFRACKRCKPTEAPLADRNAARIADACRFIDSSEEMPALATLAEHAGMSTFHFHRTFKAVTGLTPAAFARARRAERVRGELGAARSVTDAIYSAGFQSSGRFYEAAPAALGMTPTKFRRGAPELMIRFAVGQCWLGAILVAATDRGVCAVLLGDDPAELTHDLERRFPRAELVGGNRAFERTMALVVGLVERPARASKLPLDVRGTAFQKRVWKALGRIRAGKTATYSMIAKAIGAPKAVRAVAQACAANPLAVAIPCHRVVRTDGDVSGYRWGVERKRALLARETRS